MEVTCGRAVVDVSLRPTLGGRPPLWLNPFSSQSVRRSIDDAIDVTSGCHAVSVVNIHRILTLACSSWLQLNFLLTWEVSI